MCQGLEYPPCSTRRFLRESGNNLFTIQISLLVSTQASLYTNLSEVGVTSVI